MTNVEQPGMVEAVRALLVAGPLAMVPTWFAAVDAGRLWMAITWMVSTVVLSAVFMRRRRRKLASVR